MNAELQALIAEMDDDEVMKLAVAVKQDLEDEANEDVLAELGPTAAKALLDRMADVEDGVKSATDVTAMADLARSFLDALLQGEVFDEIIAENAINVGVRLGVKDLVDWFKGNFNLASLIGLRFEYIDEKKVIQHTEVGTLETSRTIKIGFGNQS
jgi:hypothetical protein